MLDRVADLLRICIALVVLAALGPVRAAYADEGPTRGTVVLDIQAGAGAPAWLATALKEHLIRELSTYERLEVRRRDAAASAACGQNRACLLDLYRAAEVDVVFFATAQTDALAYVLYETWTPSEVRAGALPLGDIDSLIGLRQSLLRAFAPVLTPGGLLDQKPYRSTRGSDRSTLGLQNRGSSVAAGTLAAVLVALALVLMLPAMAAAAVVARRRLKVWQWPSVWTAVALGAAAVIVGARAEPVLVSGWPQTAQWGLGLLGGAAWGALAVANLRLVVPLMPGLDRVAHRDVFRLLRAWLFVSGTRIAGLALYYLPFFIVGRMAAERLGLSVPSASILFAPAVGLGAYLWLASWIRAFTLFLDERLVVGEPTPDNPWHREVSRYFTGYLRRTGWALAPEVLDAIVFLPGRQEGLRCYGGGSVAPRVVIDEHTLTLAIGTTEDERDEDDAVTMPDWTAGLIAPGMPEPSSTRGRFFRASAPIRGRRDRLTSVTGHQRKQLGQAATLLGYVRPEPGERVPLIADTIEDLEVVRGLLAEHYQWYAPDPDDDHDETDPTDKDFLFGPLTYGVGAVMRKDSQLAVFWLALGEVMELVAPLRWLYRKAASVSSALFGRASTIIADAFVALHFARHHHLQYLAYRTGVDGPALTVRASVDQLQRTSTAILGELRARLARGKAVPPQRLGFQRRAVWLSSFFAEPLRDRTERLVRWGTGTTIVLVLLAGIGVSIHQAVRYHPVYVERMAEQARRAKAAAQSKTTHEGTPSNGRN